MNGILDGYHHSPHHHHHYDQSFQTVPSSVPPTPSPEQWTHSELSPHSHHSNTSGTSTGGSSGANGQLSIVPPPAHLSQMGHHHHQQHHTITVGSGGHHHPVHHSPHHPQHNASAGAHPAYASLHSRDLSQGGLAHIGSLQSSPLLSHHGLLQTGVTGADGKPVISAAVLAGESFRLNCECSDY